MTSREKRAAGMVAKRMYSVRIEQERSQKDVAKALGITQSTLSKMEHGKLIPSAVQWLDFCRLTRIEADSLLSGSGTKTVRRTKA